jgi:hypothetical protein
MASPASENHFQVLVRNGFLGAGGDITCSGNGLMAKKFITSSYYLT